ncbi:dual specificity protein phosphatase 19-like [Liolophura sinensis]|uniref:dual specificity protein phosphatase 19-like n=1 Tax=Liolophura sinensis TaxID=3198878 RepID=UPI0031597F67
MADDKVCSGLFASLQTFDKSKLKKTETSVTTVDGRRLLEKVDTHGRRTSHLVSQGILGYVGDVREDLQVAEVLPGLIMGSQDVAHNLELLRKYGVTHILNVATYVDNIYPDLFKYMDIQLLDIPETNIMVCFDQAFQFIEEARATGCVLVHCNAGVSRSATIVIAYLMKTAHYSHKEAFKYLRELRPAVCPNAGFMAQLEYFGELLNTKQQ